MPKQLILVLGPQGSGKSTQAKLLAQKLEYVFVSTGDLIRKKIKDTDEISSTLRVYMVKGELVPDDLVEELLFPFFHTVEKDGCILDGYPRTEKQLETLLAFLQSHDWTLAQVFYLAVSHEECMKRLTLRADIEHRADETPEAIAKRLELYFAQTEILLNRYDEMRILSRVDGERSIEAIQDDIQSRSKHL